MNWFIHRMLGHYLQNEAGAEGGEGGGQQQASTTEGQQQQQQSGSLLNQAANQDFIPEKYRVTKPDGSLDLEQSSRKLAESYGHLEKRMGSGDLPPKSVEEYAPKIEVEGFDFNEFKADESTQAFLKGAHAKGLTNAQLEFVIGEYLRVAPQLMEGGVQLDQQGASEALRGEWKTDAEFKSGLGASYRALQGFAGEGLGSMDNLMAKFGNDPDFIAFTARIGREMREDMPVGGEQVSEGDFVAKTAELRAKLQTMSIEDPQRKAVQAELDGLYAKRYPSGNSRFK